MANVVRENIGLLTDKLTVKVSKEDYWTAFEKKVKDYSKTANIPGFRKGMVPAGMIRKMYGPAIFQEEVLRAVERGLYEYLTQEKPDIFAQPLPLDRDRIDLDLNQPGAYDFGFEIGLKPDFELPALAKQKLTLHQVEVTDAMVNDEIDRLRIKGGKMSEPGQVSEDDTVINVSLLPCDAVGQVREGVEPKTNSLLLRYFSPALRQRLMGAKVGDKLVFRLGDSFEGDKLDLMLRDLGFEKGDKKAESEQFQMEITKLGLIEKRNLDADFFNEVYPGRNIETEDAFREALTEDIRQYWTSQSRNQLHDQIYHLLIDHTTLSFPEAFLKRWLLNGGEKPKTETEVEAEFPGFSQQLKWTLISDKIIQDNKLEVTAEDLRGHMKNEVMRYFGQMNLGENVDWLDSYIDRMMKDEKQVESTHRRLVTERLFHFLEQQIPSKPKTVTPDELNAMQHHHH